jgi:hypothetical protein
MRPELEDLFYEFFPELFRGRFKPPEESSMSFGFQCGDERLWLLLNHCMAIQQSALVWGLDRQLEEWPEVVQVKEKCGTLRFYLRRETVDMRELRDKLLIDSADGDESLL